MATGPRRQAQTPSVDVSAPFVFACFGLAMILRRHGRQRRSYADRRPRPAGHGVRRGRHSSTSSTAPCSPASAPSPGGSRSYGAARSPTCQLVRLAAARRARHRAGLAAVLHRRVRRPAGRRRAFRLRRPAELWNMLVTIGHGLMVLTVLALRRPAGRAPAATGRAAGDDPWDGRRSSGPPSSPAPDDNFAEVPTVMSRRAAARPQAAAPAETEPPDDYALPAAPPPPPRRQLLVGTAFGGVAVLMLIGGMLALWIRLRDAGARHRRTRGCRRASRSPRSRRTSC